MPPGLLSSLSRASPPSPPTHVMRRPLSLVPSTGINELMPVDLVPNRAAIYDASSDVTETAELFRTESKGSVCVGESVRFPTGVGEERVSAEVWV